MKRAVITLAVLLVAASAATAQRAKKPKVLPGQGIDWKGDFEEAMKEAQARNVPIVFHLAKDN